MQGDKVTNAVACGSALWCVFPEINQVNDYLNFIVLASSLAWIAYKFVKEWRGGDKD